MAVVYQDKKYYSPVLFTPAINQCPYAF